MTDDEFKELVHLYLDGEIAPRDAERLRREVARDSERRRAFEERCRLHRAMRLALGGGAADSGRGVAAGREGRGLGRWWPGLAAGVCVAVVSALAAPALVSPDREGASGVAAELPGAESDTAAIREVRAEDVRFLRLRDGDENGGGLRGGLAAQLRLSGLRPELAPRDRRLRPVDRDAIGAKNEAINREIRKLREAAGQRTGGYGSGGAPGTWANPGLPGMASGEPGGMPGGFSPSLVGFD